MPFHSSNSIDQIRRLRLLAIVPVLLAAVVNTGYQYLLGFEKGTEGWRESIAGVFNVGYVDPNIYDVLVSGLIHVLPVFAMALLAGGFCERLFAQKRNRAFDTGVVYTALLFTLLMPPGVGILHIVFGVAFAIIFAHGVFGGEGKSFLNPALVAVAVVQISFPSALTNHPLWTNLNGYAGTRDFMILHQQGVDGFDWWSAFLGNSQGLMGTTSVLAILFGAVFLLYARIASWRVLAGLLTGVVAMAMIGNWIGGGILDLPWYGHVLLGSFAFTAVFIATDPSSSSSTNSGRWIQGILAGVLVVIMRVVNPSHPDGVIPVMLLMSMTAPLIDHVVIWFNIRRRHIRRRRLRHG